MVRNVSNVIATVSSQRHIQFISMWAWATHQPIGLGSLGQFAEFLLGCLDSIPGDSAGLLMLGQQAIHY